MKCVVAAVLSSVAALDLNARVARARSSIVEPAALEWLGRYEVAELPSSRTTFVRTSAKTKVPLVLVHGFDSSALEFRRLLSALETQGVEAYAIDLLGWGFTEGTGVSIDEKRRQLAEFVAFLGLGDYALVGASLGGAVAIDFALANSLDRLGLIAPQCLSDGTPDVPRFLARAGVKVLASWPLRAAANRLAYFDKALATDDAIRVGRLHCDRSGWEDDQVDWLLGKGYAVSSRLADLQVNRLACYWGAKDEILPPDDAIPRLEGLFPRDTTKFSLYDECGHVPHLEKPQALVGDLAYLLEP